MAAAKLLHQIKLKEAGTGTLVDGAEALKGKVVGVVIAPHWMSMQLLDTLLSFYEHINQLKANGKPIAFVYVAVDREEGIISRIKASGEAVDEGPDLKCFDGLREQLDEDWFVVPLEDTATRSQLVKDLAEETFSLAFVNENGEVNTKDGMQVFVKWGAEGFPYSRQRIEELEKEAAERYARQSVKSLLQTPDRDYVVRNDGSQVEISELEGKTVGLYFSAHWCPPCQNFTPRLASVYKKLKEQSAGFEIVFISNDRDEESFKSYHGSIAWLALPFSDRETNSAVFSYFKARVIPRLVILGPDGKTVTDNGRNLVEKYGVKAYPFTDEHISGLEKANEEVKHPSHPEQPESEPPAVQGADTEGKEGWACEGDACRKV